MEQLETKNPTPAGLKFQMGIITAVLGPGTDKEASGLESGNPVILHVQIDSHYLTCDSLALGRMGERKAVSNYGAGTIGNPFD